ncbi:MAG: hypothetical protein KBD94_01515 [Pyrinomonadaceae bacterium]|nr:hypothetical protein [Pyrinomonadaceae bacterium]
MTKRNQTKYIIEGDYVAEVDVELLADDTSWAPYLSVEDAYRLDDVRSALRRKDIVGAARLARVFEKHPVAA